MEVKELIEQARGLEKSISDASGDQRFELHDQLHRTLELIKLNGGKVPTGLHRLDLDLVDEAVEAAFDNVPI